MTWRLLRDSDLSGARNMARDAAILDTVSRGASPSCLRLYTWRPPCLSLGRHQPVAAANLDFCARAGVDVVRRPTGGRAVLHHLELTYAVVSPLGRGVLPRNLQGAYRQIASALVRALRTLGVAAELTSGEVNLSLPGPRTAVPCFEAPAGGEVVVGGRKLVGSAARCHEKTLLQHGAILLDWDGRLQAGTMGLADDAGLRRSLTTVSEQLGTTPARADLERALVAAFEAELGVEIAGGELRLERELEGTFVVQHG